MLFASLFSPVDLDRPRPLPGLLRALGAAVFVSLMSGAVSAQEFARNPSTWQEHLDLHTAAAAAATVLHVRCSSDERQHDSRAEVGRRVGQLLEDLERSGVPKSASYPYAQESYRLKVLALWQSSQGLACSAAALPRLRDLANWGQYSLPSSVR